MGIGQLYRDIGKEETGLNLRCPTSAFRPPTRIMIQHVLTERNVDQLDCSNVTVISTADFSSGDRS